MQAQEVPLSPMGACSPLAPEHHGNLKLFCKSVSVLIGELNML